MNYATRCGQDADCNPASAAGVLGTLIGARAIPAEYRQPLHNTYWNKSLAASPIPSNPMFFLSTRLGSV